MAQVTQVKIICDECLRATGEQTEATEYDVLRKKVALCDEHYTNLLEPVLPLFKSISGGKGRKVAASASKAPSKAAEDVSCGECGEVFHGSNYKRPKQALVMHVRNKHAA